MLSLGELAARVLENDSRGTYGLEQVSEGQVAFFGWDMYHALKFENHREPTVCCLHQVGKAPARLLESPYFVGF